MWFDFIFDIDLILLLLILLVYLSLDFSDEIFWIYIYYVSFQIFRFMNADSKMYSLS